MEEKNAYLKKPFRVSHTNGDVIAGFDDLPSARQNAVDRNVKAKELGLDVLYVASARL